MIFKLVRCSVCEGFTHESAARAARGGQGPWAAHLMCDCEVVS